MKILDNKHLIKMHEMFESKHSIYLIIDYIEGQTLSEILKQRKKLKEIDVKRILKGLLDGIKEMQDKNIMHRDIKPENILIKNGKIDSENIYLVDFGLATYQNEKQYLFVRCGTPGFVAPEILHIKDKMAHYDKICDVFSIGIVFHWMFLYFFLSFINYFVLFS